MWYVIVPHIVKTVYPALANYFIVLTLSTSMAMILGVEELLGTVHRDAMRVRRMVADADAERLVGKRLALGATLARSSQPVDILLGGVDRVPGETLVERQHVEEALPPVRPRGAPDVVAGDLPLRPLAALELEAAAARDPQLGVARELLEQTLEVVRLERDVGVDLHDDIHGPVELLQRGRERAHGRRRAGRPVRGRDRQRASPLE